MPITLNPSNSDTRKFKVAAIQAEPVWLDLQGGVAKTIRLINEAAANGAKIIGFPEVLFQPGLYDTHHVAGYPWTPWANDFISCQSVLKEYQENALPLHSPEMDRICEAVRAADTNVVLGFAERDGGSIYIARLPLLPMGRLRITVARSKYPPPAMCPGEYVHTYFLADPLREDYIGDGSAQSIHNVVQTEYGRLGSLNCWEQIQPWLKTHFYSQYPQIFVGGWWPAFPPLTGGSPYIVSGEASSRMTQLVAMEGGCFGLVCCHVVSKEGAEKMKLTGFPWFVFPGGGFTTIYGPDGAQLAKSVDPGVETTVYSTISLDKIAEVKVVADTMGN
ncbi:carbon-nitrogen hydrolase [Infundibulicybe gibba]|nr:carbon-nitrogen hydrolase [Infundibulicybe gibba]